MNSSTKEPAPSPALGGFSTTATGLKLRVQNVAKTLQNQTDVLGEDRTYLNHIKSATSSADHGLTKELDDIQRYFQAELQQMDEDFKVKVSLFDGIRKNAVDVQKNENVRLQQCLTTLKTEKTMLHQQIISMQHKVEGIEEEIGSEHMYIV
ncbi:hypothetical protein FOZ63_023311 [Perkinsus olseni]|uniref:Uncharacterized protein n=1 Tax=Perkinsus olseni TaxID=32597 RepID=A0A7J6R6S3_PEROL|nr:hypothetical protein FOZ63_023311 [Perkinsus olseni]